MDVAADAVVPGDFGLRAGAVNERTNFVGYSKSQGFVKGTRCMWEVK